MARQRRSTSGIISRIAAITGFIITMHIIARILHMMGVLAVQDYVSNEGSYMFDKVPVTFWDMSQETVYFEWIGILFLHILAAVVLLVIAAIAFLIRAFFRWIFFEPERDPGCQDASCRCIEHKGMVFDENDDRWYYPGDGSANLAIGIATGVTVGIAAGS